MGPASARKAIDKYGMLLVFPIQGKPEPSLWSVAYPGEEMRWEWDENGDDRVARLWHLREELSRSKKVIYTKWYRGRATFFSRPVFSALLSQQLANEMPLSRDAKKILALLEESSPQSTKQIKKESGLQGRLLESTYQKAMKELWQSLKIVAFGEVADGAFPSLAVGSTKLLFEDLYEQAAALSEQERNSTLAATAKKFGVSSWDQTNRRKK